MPKQGDKHMQRMGRVIKLSAKPLWQLRIELMGIKPVIWRRVLVPGTITLGKLHQVIQEAMGWLDVHLHEFFLKYPPSKAHLYGHKLKLAQYA